MIHKFWKTLYPRSRPLYFPFSTLEIGRIYSWPYQKKQVKMKIRIILYNKNYYCMNYFDFYNLHNLLAVKRRYDNLWINVRFSSILKWIKRCIRIPVLRNGTLCIDRLRLIQKEGLNQKPLKCIWLRKKLHKIYLVLWAQGLMMSWRKSDWKKRSYPYIWSTWIEMISSWKDSFRFLKTI